MCARAEFELYLSIAYFKSVEIVDLLDVKAFTFKIELSIGLRSEVVELGELACHYLKIN